MFNNPQINSPAFQALKLECNKRHLSLFLARTEKVYHDIGGNYAVYSRFANMQLCNGETLQDIADFLKIGGVYD